MGRRWRSQSGAAWTGLVLSAVFALMALGSADEDAHLGDAAVVTEAVVDEYRHGYRFDDLTFTFRTADGTEVTAVSGVWATEADAGDTILVRYDPLDPSYARPVGEDSNVPWTLVSVGIALGSAAVAVAGFRGRLPEWLLNR